MIEEPCIICGRGATASPAKKEQVDTRGFKCEENCGNYFFQNGLNEHDYEDLDGEKRAKIADYIRAYNKANDGEWATLGDIEELWKKIDLFNEERKEEAKK